MSLSCRIQLVELHLRVLLPVFRFADKDSAFQAIAAAKVIMLVSQVVPFAFVERNPVWIAMYPNPLSLRCLVLAKEKHVTVQRIETPLVQIAPGLRRDTVLLEAARH
jgi:hypothetical protein